MLFSTLCAALPMELFGFQIMQEEEKSMEFNHTFQFINITIIHLEMTLGHRRLQASVSFEMTELPARLSSAFARVIGCNSS